MAMQQTFKSKFRDMQEAKKPPRKSEFQVIEDTLKKLKAKEKIESKIKDYEGEVLAIPGDYFMIQTSKGKKMLKATNKIVLQNNTLIEKE